MANPNIVSVTSIYGGNAGWNLSSTLTATLLTVDADKIVKINSIICSNVDGTNVTATAAELNYVDGVTSAIQTQMDTKASTGKAIAMAIVFG